MRRYIASVALFSLACTVTSYATDEDDCGSLYEDPDTRIAACTRWSVAPLSDAGFALFNRGQAQEDKGDFDSAIADYSEAIRQAPYMAPYAYLYRGDIYLNKNELERAKADWDEAIRAADNAIQFRSTALNYTARALIRSRLGQYEAALTDLGEAVRRDPTESLHLEERARLHGIKGDMQHAYADINEAIRLAPDIALYYVLRGWIYEQNVQYDLATQDYDRALVVDPNNAPAHSMRARTLALKGDAGGSASELELAKKKLGVTGYHIARARIYEGGGQREKALIEYEWVLKIDPKQRNALVGRERLQQGQLR
jgi:tetratricopeptide (TPR) repeat protein